MCTVATPRVIFKLVGKHHLTTDVEALAVVVVTAQTAVHRSHRHIACTSHRRIRLRTVAEVEREVGAKLESVARVGFPLNAEIATHVVSLGARGGSRVVIAGGVGENVTAVGSGARVAVAVVVVHITASTEFLAVLRAHIEVETEVLAGGDTAVVAKSHEA